MTQVQSVCLREAYAKQRKKRREDPILAQDGSSSVPDTYASKLRPRGQTRTNVDDPIDEDIEMSERIESSDDDVDDENFRVEPRHGKGAVVADDSDDGVGDEQGGNDDGGDGSGDNDDNDEFEDVDPDVERLRHIHF